MGDYRKLRVWQRARAIEGRVRKMIQQLPAHERANIGDQILRAARSIRLNIVEGSGLNTDPQLAKHLSQALGSANELQDGIDIIDEAGMLPELDRDLITEVARVRGEIASFHKTVMPRKRKRRPKERRDEANED